MDIVQPSKENKSEEKLQDGWFDLAFNVKRSRRYHCRRRAFFESWALWTSFLSIAFGGYAAFNARAPEQVFRWGGSILAIISTANIVIGFAKRGREHFDLEREFISLEREMEGVGLSPKESDLIKFRQKRHEIERNEPPKKCALDVICHNETARALGISKEHMVAVSLVHRLFAQFFDFDGDKFSLRSEQIAPQAI